MIVDGRAIASDILKETRTMVAGRVPVVRAITVQASSATLSYLSIKKEQAEEAGMRLEVATLPDGANEDDIIAAIEAPGADAVIVQLPIPKELDLKKVLNAIPLEKDADVLSDAAYARFENEEAGALVPPVAAGVAEIFARTGVTVAGKRAVIAGRGKLVGKPCAALMKRMGAQVDIVSSDTENPVQLYREAGIIISGTGRAHTITPDVVKDGVVLIDAGTSGTSGTVTGDIDPACAAKASVFTPVPGGVGPVAVACLFKNVAHLVQTA